MSLRVNQLPDGQALSWQDELEHLWIDLERPEGSEVAKLEAHFALNPLALADALEAEHWSRFERYLEHFS